MINPFVMYMKMSGSLVAAAELSVFLNISLSTVSRQLNQLIAEGSVARFGKGKNTKFIYLRKVTGVEQPVIVREINEQAKIAVVRKLWITDQGTIMETANELLTYDDLPWYFLNLKPAGFIGRSIAQYASRKINTPIDLENWNNDDLLRYLVNFHNETPSHFELFANYKPRLLRYNAKPPKKILKDYDKYVDVLDQTIDIESSAGGEQPKFNYRLHDRNNNSINSYLVKFSPRLDIGNPIAERVKDLLVCEHIALTVLAEYNGHAVSTTLQISDERLYLEIIRFDRVPVHYMEGQVGVVSLDAVVNQYLGRKSLNWIEASIALKEKGMLSKSDANLLQTWFAYSRFIGNNDTYNDNVSLFLKDLKVNGLTPAYDISPMIYMPTMGDIPSPEIKIRKPNDIDGECWALGRKLGLDFWSRIVKNKTLSDEFVEIGKQWIAYIKFTVIS